MNSNCNHSRFLI